MIFLNGGGACWQDFYFCTPVAEETLPDQTGAFRDSFDTGTEVIDSPFKGFSKMFVSYCDGSVFSGDNEVPDANYPLGPVRYHRGLRNLSAAIDQAASEFPHARKIVLSGASAGGVGASGFAPFLARFAFGNFVDLKVFNDAGPVAVNPNNPVTAPAAAARQADWLFDQFYPGSCTQCDPLGSATGVIDWRLDNDRTIREAHYATDGDSTNRFFLAEPTQSGYRDLLLSQHEPLNADFPRRYKNFIRSGTDEHTVLGRDDFFVYEIDGTPLWKWTKGFVRNKRRHWRNLIEDFSPIP